MNYYIITGTSRGIGKALAKYLGASPDNRIIGISRAYSLSLQNYKHVEADLADIPALLRNVDSLLEVPDDATSVTLVNNAGTIGEIGHLGSISDESIDYAMRLNVTSPMILTNAFMRLFANRNVAKCVINISSGAARNAYDGWSSYCASKAALDMLGMVLAQETALDESDMNVYSIAPGVVDTEMQARVRSSNGQGFRSKQIFVDMKEKGQLASPESVAEKLARVIQHPEEFGDLLIDFWEPAE
ncbi:short-chain dehydrogenase [Fulvitalea axinellae]|uniref:Short-chain dehydrogenase n=1 Tax=Fulvitalea axinellae TaxID=1182444 RepID=A0AAU9CQP7_9BACT|nr:short-chain dehydrogenase [Fulvitalea axinellae]